MKDDRSIGLAGDSETIEYAANAGRVEFEGNFGFRRLIIFTHPSGIDRPGYLVLSQETYDSIVRPAPIGWEKDERLACFNPDVLRKGILAYSVASLEAQVPGWRGKVNPIDLKRIKI